MGAQASVLLLLFPSPDQWGGLVGKVHSAPLCQIKHENHQERDCIAISKAGGGDKSCHLKSHDEAI